MSFVRPELRAALRAWREPIVWGALFCFGLWQVAVGYLELSPLNFLVGLAASAAGFGLLRDALRRRWLRGAEPSEGVVMIDEARIAYLGPRGGGFVDLPAVVSVEIVPRPHVLPDSGHAWLIRAEDGSELVIPIGAHGADALVPTLSALPGIDFDQGVAAVAEPGAHRATLWRKAG